MYCNRSCLWVCYHDNSKLRASILTKLGLYFVGSDHLQLIKFWPSRAPGKGSAAGRNFLVPPYYNQCAVFVSPLSVFSLFNLADNEDTCGQCACVTVASEGVTLFHLCCRMTRRRERRKNTG